MPKFCLNQNKNVSGASELHAVDGDCGSVPNEFEQVPIGYFISGEDALTKAKQLYPLIKIESCFHCCAQLGIDKQG